MKRACVLAVAIGCTHPAPAPAPAPAPDLDRAACDHLCADEVRCSGADRASCDASCTADAARMKPGFVARYVECFDEALVGACGKLSDAARTEAHERCFDRTLATFPRDEKNQRDMAEAVCDRAFRCQNVGKTGRDACMQATLDPKEPEVKLGQRVVDAFRRARVESFRACIEKSPCPAADAHDDAVDHCYATTVAGQTAP